MEEVFNYLKTLEVNFLATKAGDIVSCRPFGDPVKFDNKIYMLTHAEKSVAKQLAADNRICIVAYNPKRGTGYEFFVKQLMIAIISQPSKPSSTNSTGPRKLATP